MAKKSREESRTVVSFRVPMPKYRKLKSLAEGRDESLSDIVNRAVNVYLKIISGADKLEDNNS